MRNSHLDVSSIEARKRLWRRGVLPPVGVEWTEVLVEVEGVALVGWIQGADNLHFEKFCFGRGYALSKFKKFRELSVRFCECWERARDLQRVKLMDLGLAAKDPTRMAIMLLSYYHGVREKSEVEVSAKPIWLDPEYMRRIQQKVVPLLGGQTVEVKSEELKGEDLDL